MPAIEARGLRRAYRTSTGILRRRTIEVEAVRGVDFEVGEGKLFGLLGPNGAGKTTIKMLITLLIPTGGTARVLGYDVVRDARELRTTIASLTAAGKTVLLTTHYMFEADDLCDRIAVINKGEIVAHGTPRDLKAVVADRTVIEIEVFGVAESAIERLRGVPGVTSVSVEEREQAQLLLVQSARGRRADPNAARLARRRRDRTSRRTRADARGRLRRARGRRAVRR